jgi:hypothetical protein
MADDVTYQALNEQISESFAESDWDALVECEGIEESANNVAL